MSQTITSSPFSHVSYTYKHTYFFTVSWQIIYLHLFNHTNILHIFTTIPHFQIISLYLSQIYCPDHKKYHLLHTPVHILTCIFTSFSTKGQCKNMLQSSLKFHFLGFLSLMTFCTSTNLCLITSRKQLLKYFTFSNHQLHSLSLFIYLYK